MLLNLIKHQGTDIDKIYLFVKYSVKSKYQLLITGRKKIGIENFKNLKTLIDYSQTIVHVYKSLEDYNTTKKRRILIVFDDV